MYIVYMIIDSKIIDEKKFRSVIKARELVKQIIGDREFKITSIPFVDCYFMEKFYLFLYRE